MNTTTMWLQAISRSTIDDYNPSTLEAIIAFPNDQVLSAAIPVIRDNSLCRQEALMTAVRLGKPGSVQKLLSCVNPREDTMKPAIKACELHNWAIFCMIIQKSKGLLANVRVIKAVIATGDAKFVNHLFTVKQSNWDLMTYHALDCNFAEIAQQIVNKAPQGTLFARSIPRSIIENRHELVVSMQALSGADLSKYLPKMIHRMDERMALLIVGTSKDIDRLANSTFDRVCKNDWVEVLKIFKPYIRPTDDFVNLVGCSSFQVNQILVDVFQPCYQDVIAATYLRWVRVKDLSGVVPLMKLLPEHYDSERVLAYGEMMFRTGGTRYKTHAPDDLIWGHITGNMKRMWLIGMDSDIRCAWRAEIAGTEFDMEIATFDHLFMTGYWIAARRCAKPL